MKLDHVQIKNYRSIQEIELNFDSSCRVLVGINESGKSNILNALSLLSDDYTPEKSRDQREALPDENTIKESFVKFVFKFEKKELDKIFNILSSKILSRIKNPDIVLLDGNNKSIRNFCNIQNKSFYHVDILKQEKTPRYRKCSENKFTVLDGWKKPTDTCPADFQVELEGQKHTLKDYKFIQSNDFYDIPENYLENVTLQDLNNFIGSIVTDTTKQNLPKVIFWNYKEENLLPTSVNIDEFIKNQDFCVPLKNMFILSGIENISDSIQDKRTSTSTPNQFQNYLTAIASKTTKHFKQVWKDYKNIEFSLKKEHNCIIPGVKEQNTYDFDKRSDGFKRFVTFLLMISTRVKTHLLENTLLLVDEAEISLHPSGVRYLRDELIKIANDNHVVYSTHSTFMIDSGDISRHYIVKKEDEITTIRQVEDSNIVDEEVLYNALGFSIFEVLKKKNIIFEGWRDKFLFQKYLQKQPKELRDKYKNVGTCHAKGVKNIRIITPMIELANRKCLIISDSDKTAQQHQKEFKKEKSFGNWKTYLDIDTGINAVTAEDFIKNDFITEKINKILCNMNHLNFSENILSEKDKLKKIKSWLKENGIPPDEQDDIIEKIKNSIFNNNLKPENIDDKYKKLIEAIPDYL